MKQYKNLAEKIELLVTNGRGYYDGRFAYERRTEFNYFEEDDRQNLSPIHNVPDLAARILRRREEGVLDRFFSEEERLKRLEARRLERLLNPLGDSSPEKNRLN